MDHLNPYIPLGMIVLLAMAFGTVNIILGSVFGPKRPNPSKAIAYESGIAPDQEANVRVPIKFYMVAILFLIFDIESIYMIAWAIVFRGTTIDFKNPEIGFTQGAFTRFAFMEMLTFIAILLVGYVYVWRKGGFKWS